MTGRGRLGLLGLCSLIALGASGCGEGEEGEGGPLMKPGKACLGCHGIGSGGEEEAEAFGFAGTVFETRAGDQAAEGVVVVVQDMSGDTIEVDSNRAGNFYTQKLSPPPLKVELRSGDRVLVMEAPSPTGDCNDCHSGDGGAGRLARP